MHYFLTGVIQVGKSTIIKKLVSSLGLDAGGFMTRWTGTGSGRVLILAPFGADIVGGTEIYTAAVYENGKMIPYIGVFDTAGPRILADSRKHDVIIMDELGFLESQSYAFQEAVMKTLDSDVPVLGVIQPRDTMFLNAVRARPDVRLITVTVENRDRILSELISMDLFPRMRDS